MYSFNDIIVLSYLQTNDFMNWMVVFIKIPILYINSIENMYTVYKYHHPVNKNHLFVSRLENNNCLRNEFENK